MIFRQFYNRKIGTNSMQYQQARIEAASIVSFVSDNLNVSTPPRTGNFTAASSKSKIIIVMVAVVVDLVENFRR